MLLAVEKSAQALLYGSDELLGDKDFVLLAMCQDPSVLQFALDELLDNQQFMLEALNLNPSQFLLYMISLYGRN
jgi:hypothetical protein